MSPSSDPPPTSPGFPGPPALHTVPYLGATALVWAADRLDAPDRDLGTSMDTGVDALDYDRYDGQGSSGRGW